MVSIGYLELQLRPYCKLFVNLRAQFVLHNDGEVEGAERDLGGYIITDHVGVMFANAGCKSKCAPLLKSCELVREA